MARQSKQIASKTIPQAQGFDPDQKQAKTERVRAERNHFPSLAERLAQSDVKIGNWRWPGAAQDFKHDLRMAYVALYFPYAKGGPLLVDLPDYDVDRKACERKAEVLRAKGYRYVILYRGIEESDAMEALDRCLEKREGVA